MRETWNNRQSGTGHCEECPGMEAPYPLMFGNENANVMIVGIEPAYNIPENIDMTYSWEEAKSKFYENREEEENTLWEAICAVSTGVGCNPRELYITNLTKCNPAFDDEDSNNPCTDECHPYLFTEMDTIDPEIVVLFGVKPTDAVFEKYDIKWSEVIGDYHKDEHFEKDGMVFLPFYHWGSLRFSSMTEKEYYDDIEEKISHIIKNN